jgi:hypothetical protein
LQFVKQRKNNNNNNILLKKKKRKKWVVKLVLQWCEVKTTDVVQWAPILRGDFGIAALRIWKMLFHNDL